MSSDLSDPTAAERTTAGATGLTAGDGNDNGSDGERPGTDRRRWNRQRRRRGRRAVSYALGFVVVFAAVLAGTLALFVVGVDVLSAVDRDGAIAANQENVEVIHSEVGDVTTQGADSRDLTLELVDTQLRVTDSEALTLRVEFDGLTVEYETRALRYEVVGHGTTFVYAFGHLHRVDDDGGAISEKPPVFEVSSGQTRLVVPVLTGPTAEGPSEIGVSGTGERSFAAVRSNASSFTRTGTGGAGLDTSEGTVTIEGVEYPTVWERALESTGFQEIEVTGEPTAVTGQFESDRLTVQQAEIALALGGKGS